MAVARNPSSADAFVGRMLRGKYRIVRRLGEGGWGMVFEAEHLLLRKNVAIKLLHSDLAHDVKFAERFRREALASSQIGHPNIIEVYDLDSTEDGIEFMVLELLSGEDLAARLSTGRTLPLREALAIFGQVASALAAAHAVGIIHRDLKPDNIVLCRKPDGGTHVKIVDFGIAKLDASLIDAQGTITQTGTMLGTPYYMSPEQIRAERSLDHRTDLYSMGVMMYEALAGAPPFEAPNLPTLVARILYEPYVPLSERRPDLPAALTDLVARMLEREVADRPSDMALVAATLEMVAADVQHAHQALGTSDEDDGDEERTLVMESSVMSSEHSELERTLVEAPSPRDILGSAPHVSGEHRLAGSSSGDAFRPISSPGAARPGYDPARAPSSGSARRPVEASAPNIRVADIVSRPSEPWHEVPVAPTPTRTEALKSPPSVAPEGTSVGTLVLGVLVLIAVGALSYFVVLHL